MAFRQARSRYFRKENVIIDDTTEEILDYLLRSRNFLSELTLLKLNHKVKMTFSNKMSGFVQGFFKSSNVSNSKNSLVIFFTVIAFAGNCYSHNSVFAVTNEQRQQIININNDGSALIHFNDLSENVKNNDKIVPISEELKDNLLGVKPGQPIMIIPKNSKVHIVKKGENLVKISTKYNIPLKKLIAVNPKVDLLKLTEGDKLIIPDMKIASIRSHRYMLASRGFSPSIGFSQDRLFKWPTEGVRQISSNFGIRGFRRHLGVDIVGRYGDPIVAAKSGVVSFSGWSGDYGQCVIIDHGYGIQTLYAHASKLLISAGQSVNAGQEIARIGQTGRATGPHLHFQVMLNGTPKNPERYLRS